MLSRAKIIFTKKKSLMQNITDRLLTIIDICERGNAAAFAKNLGISQSTFHYYIKGRAPNMNTLIHIHDKYNINMNWLLTGQGEMHLEGGGTESINKEGAEGPGAEVIPINKVSEPREIPDHVITTIQAWFRDADVSPEDQARLIQMLYERPVSGSKKRKDIRNGHEKAS